MSRISPFAHAFVGLVFGALGLSFLISTGLLVYEFWDLDWRTMVFAHSHLFFFFPVFGILVLAAFYIPAAVFTDFYWKPKNLTFGRVRFAIGTLAVVGASLWFTNGLSQKAPRGIWEISPVALGADIDTPQTTIPGCVDADGQTCIRKPIFVALQSLRVIGQQRRTIAEFARNCKPDPLLHPPPSDQELRWCFPAGARMTRNDCCLVQERFQADLSRLYKEPQTRSKSAYFETILTFFKVFFVIVLVVVGVLLVIWQDHIARRYENRLPSIERGVIIGAIAMLFWLLMDYGYQQTTNVLNGRDSDGFPFRLSLVVAPWTAVLVLYFVKRTGSALFNLAQISTITASTVAVLRYEQISDYSVRLLGSGAEDWLFTVLIAVAIAGLGAVYGPWKLPLPPARKHPKQLAPGPTLGKHDMKVQHESEIW